MTMEEVIVPGQAPKGPPPPGPGTTRPGIPGTIRPRKGPGGRRPTPKGKKSEEPIDPFKDPENPYPPEMEEVHVYGKYPILGPADFLGGGHGIGPYWGEVIDRFVIPWINKYFEEEVDAVNEALTEIFKDEAKTALEVYDSYTDMALNGTNGLSPDALLPEITVPDRPTYATDIHNAGLMEHVHVTAPRISTSGTIITDISFGLDWVTNFAFRPMGVLPRRALSGDAFKQETPSVRPYGRPDIGPKVNPMPEIVPDKDYVPDYDGSVGVDFKPDKGLSFNLRLTPRTSTRRPSQENKQRKDKKHHKAARTYRSVLIMVTRTYGTYTELRDLYEAFAWNVKVDGKFLVHHSDPIAALLAGFTGESEMTINWQGMAVDMALMQGMDRFIGQTARIGRRALNNLNYWGPNPGSYTPDYPEEP